MVSWNDQCAKTVGQWIGIFVQVNLNWIQINGAHTECLDLSTVSLTSSVSAGFNVPFAISIAFTRAAASAAAAIPQPPAPDVTVDIFSGSATSSGRTSHLLSEGALSHLLSSGNLSCALSSGSLSHLDFLSRFIDAVASWMDDWLSLLSGPLSHLLSRFLQTRYTISNTHNVPYTSSTSSRREFHLITAKQTGINQLVTCHMRLMDC